tara:strand:+ start:2111 stop:2380 length:270 start_codon:yes stop_codon:yes gene_type:complete
MNKFILILIIFLGVLLYKLFDGESNIFDFYVLKDQVQNLIQEEEKLSEKNEILKAQLQNLRTGSKVIEEKARTELGLIKEDEIFYQIVK